MKLLLVNGNITEVKGGTESFFLKLRYSLGQDTRIISYNTALKSFMTLGHTPSNQEAVMYHTIDRYLSIYEKVNDVDLIIREAGIGGFYDLKTPQIATFGNPYNTIYTNLSRQGFGAKTHNLQNLNILLHLQKKCGDMAKVNVALSKFMARDMRRIGVTNNVKIINNAVNINAFKPMEKEKIRIMYGIPNDKKVAIWVGSVHAVKGYHIIRELVKKRKDIFWILVFKYKAEVQGKKISANNVKIFTEADTWQMINLYNCADFLLLPSVSEGCSHTVIEAMACDIPVITTNTGQLWETDIKGILTVEDYGIKVNYWNVLSYNAALEELPLNEYSPRKYIIDNKLDMETWGNKWRELVKEVVE